MSEPILPSSKEYLLQAIETALEAMRDCQHNAHGGKVCFDGDEWHERWATLSETRRRLKGSHETKEIYLGIAEDNECLRDVLAEIRDHSTDPWAKGLARQQIGPDLPPSEMSAQGTAAPEPKAPRDEKFVAYAEPTSMSWCNHGRMIHAYWACSECGEGGSVQEISEIRPGSRREGHEAEVGCSQETKSEPVGLTPVACTCHVTWPCPVHDPAQNLDVNSCGQLTRTIRDIIEARRARPIACTCHVTWPCPVHDSERCLVAGCGKPALVTADGAVGGMCRDHNDSFNRRESTR